MDVRVRSIETRDAPVVAVLMRGLGFDPSAEEIERRMRLASRRDVDRAFLAETHGGNALGLIAVHIAPLLFYPQPLARITTLVVAEEARRRGVGRRLIEFAYDLAKKADCDTLELTTGLGRADAHAFYQAQGFHRSAFRLYRRVR
ncbi:GNAT family N-acetyltransferase [Methylobacterium sp. E-066]|uniref:GNAT family N-acetyltransferase n=1 Tax=Methylobacterium sp. E-066 TaxID=2836584 RepID=UPI001FBAB18D|nr:GNAT family N-acetyltransferase [Methylobacterium sp. E-066]MCJ2140925.1 GNAT family N-acetyltransferase [Methylobacterium sp. E-066]